MSPFSGNHASAKKIASDFAVSEKTVRRSEQFADALESASEICPGVEKKILSGEVEDAITYLPKLIKEPDSIKQEVLSAIANSKKNISIKKVKKNIYTRGNKTPIMNGEPSIDIRRGDFRDVLADIPPNSVDIILTDPPYGKKYLPLWEDLGEFAARVLKKDGILVSYSGHMYLPEVISLLSVHLDWWWLCAVEHTGNIQITPLGQPVRKVKNMFKPILIFVPKDGKGFSEGFPDLFKGHGTEKEGHNWQQALDESIDLLKVFAPHGGLVVDPFAGSGTTGKAAKALNMDFIGAEILEESIAEGD